MFHYKSHAKVLNVQPDVAGDPLREQRYPNLYFRYIAIHDAAAAERQDWLERVLTDYEVRDFGSHPDRLTSRAPIDFDVVVFGGEDQRRLAVFMRERGVLLLDKVKLVLCRRSDPQRRATLLKAGFDDVIEVRRIQSAEFRVRVLAIWRRYQLARLRRLDAWARHCALERVCQVEALSAGQRQIVDALLNSVNSTTRIDALRLAASPVDGLISRASLTVMISNIRKLLRPGYRIVTAGPFAYQLSGPQLVQ